MAVKTSFKDVLFNQYENEMFDALSNFLEDDPEAAELDVEDLQTVEPYSFSIRFVQVENAPGWRIHLNIAIEAELLISTLRRRFGQEDDMRSQWFSLEAGVDLGDTLSAFEILSVDVYRGKRKAANPLSESLVPILWKSELDVVAEKFLRHFCPDALQTPQPLDVGYLTTQLGVSVRPAKLSRNSSIFGVMVFADAQVKVDQENHWRIETVPAGTLFYDPEVYFLRTLGSVRNTIVHECVHWVFHRKAMALERIFNPDVTTIECQVEEVSERSLKSNQPNPLDWMEWHANALAPRILMPKSSFQKKSDSIIAELKKQYQTDKTSDIIEQAIVEMAQFFQVSKLSAKLRFMDLGYEEARGALNYHNHSYAPSYAFEKGSIKGNQSFTLSTMDFAAVYAVDRFQKGRLHTLFDQGAVKYVEYSICLNDPRYIQKAEDGHYSLTDYARKHRDECCFKFNVSWKKTASFGQVSQFYLFKKQIEDLIPQISYEATENGQLLDKAEALELQAKQAKALSDLILELPGSFSKSLIKVMQVYGVTVEKLADLAKCDQRTIQRYRNNPACTFQQDTVINICVGMKLPLPLAQDLLRKAGCPLGNSERDIVIGLVIANANYENNFDFHVQCENILRAIP